MSAPAGPVRPSRVDRAARARRARRGIAAGVVAILVLAVGAFLVTRGDGSNGEPDDDRAASSRPEEPTLVALQVQGGPAPLLAVVGVPADGTPFVMPLSSELTLVVPGQGETSAAGVAALPADSMRTALSNMTGVWIPHHAVLSLKDRKILILDEFTSALDSRTEQQIIDNLKPHLKGKTVIIIAHRLATLQKLADRVVVLEAGKVVEEGSHRELVSQGSRYAELVRLQNIA